MILKPSHLKKTSRIFVGMSGGVDSSVVAALLKDQGYQVVGLFMKNWDETDENGVCSSQKDYEDVAKVCDHIGIPYYSVNFVEEYQQQVFDHFLTDYEQGFTPNPDILCNREIKFNVFLKKAKALGADFLATGHYCQLDYTDPTSPLLLKGKDPNKDQSYFLHAVPKELFKDVLFPIGGLEKTEVRVLAQKYGLATQDKKDSTGICFIGKRKFQPFLENYIRPKKGEFRNLDETPVGTHLGAHYYTLGQRKGLGLGGPGDPWFVVKKNISKNRVYVERGETHPALFTRWLKTDDFNWLVSKIPRFPFDCKIKVRYRQIDQDAFIQEEEGAYKITFKKPQRAVTPGQYVVLYQDKVCLGGGRIKSVSPTLWDEKTLASPSQIDQNQ
ncbi:MAG: tRNA 2-thiouridine(34) synthase MnmA [Bdellovibrionaceae bacterium]|nr:tRNA 2-thiouridine(34) synthase MnmA [Pseudobdellovibrionaceae bacterium]|tara:strand:- start:2891 stop:4045 length:1155 start_codon:yes stop_codon:yes gene_type:complete